jgi:hypothetical protein
MLSGDLSFLHQKTILADSHHRRFLIFGIRKRPPGANSGGLQSCHECILFPRGEALQTQTC